MDAISIKSEHSSGDFPGLSERQWIIWTNCTICYVLRFALLRTALRAFAVDKAAFGDADGKLRQEIMELALLITIEPDR